MFQQRLTQTSRFSTPIHKGLKVSFEMRPADLPIRQFYHPVGVPAVAGDRAMQEEAQQSPKAQLSLRTRAMSARSLFCEPLRMRSGY